MENQLRTVQNPAPRRRNGRVFLDASAQAVLSLTSFVLGFLWWCIRWGFATIFFVGIMAFAGYYVFNRAAAGGSYVTVPNVVDMPIEKAVIALADQGLELGKPEQMASDQPTGRVIAQRPSAGSVVRSGRKVFPTVSTAHELEVPNLVGKTLAEAADIVHNYGYKLALNPARLPNPQPSNTILSQDPPAGKKSPSGGSEIAVLVSDGPSQNLQMMPDLVGRRIEEVAALLTPLGLTGVAQAVEAPDEAFGYVLEQSPAPGTFVLPSTKVTFKVRATEPEKVLAKEYKREVLFSVPFSWVDREVSFEFLPKLGRPETSKRTVKGGETYPLKAPFVSSVDEVTVNIYIDGRKVQSQYFKGDSPAVITSVQQ